MTSQLKSRYRRKFALITLFSIAMGFAEAAVVVYLRFLYYPEGFAFPIKDIPNTIIGVELAREIATIIMLITVAALAAKRFWERFGFFIISFGIWDICYYIYLKIILDWPASIFDWDILFLIPIPWIGPVFAPALISVIMTTCGILIIRIYANECQFRPPLLSWILALTGISAILYSFIRDTDATLRLEFPRPFLYWLFGIGIALSILSFVISYRRALKKTKK